MKRFPIILSSIFLLVLMNACLVVSLHPVGTTADRIFDRDLIGNWAYPDGYYHFQSQGDSVYFLEMCVKQALTTDQYDTLRFEVSLHQVGPYQFLDYFPYDEGTRSEQILYNNYLPVHTFVKLTKAGKDNFKIHYFDNERLQKLFEQNRIRLRYEKVDDITVLTDGTEEIQRFLAKYAGDAEAFEEVIELKR